MSFLLNGKSIWLPTYGAVGHADAQAMYGSLSWTTAYPYTLAAWIWVSPKYCGISSRLGALTIMALGNSYSGAQGIRLAGATNLVQSFVLSGVNDTSSIRFSSFGKWAHVAATFEQTSRTCYLNGVPGNTGTANCNVASTATLCLLAHALMTNLGGSNYVNYIPFPLGVQWPVIFSRALSAAEIRALALGAHPRFFPNIVAIYDCRSFAENIRTHALEAVGTSSDVFMRMFPTAVGHQQGMWHKLHPFPAEGLPSFS